MFNLHLMDFGEFSGSSIAPQAALPTGTSEIVIGLTLQRTHLVQS